MGLFFNRNDGGLMNIIRCDEENYLVWKWRPSIDDDDDDETTGRENEIRYGSSLRVKDGEMAVFVYKKDGEQVMDFIQGPYDGFIKSDNFPVLASIVGMAWGGASPFQAEIYFINLQGNNQIKFAVPYFDVADPRFLDLTVPVAVRGTITFNLTDAKQFIKLNRLVDFDLEQFREQINGAVRKTAKNFVVNCPIEQGISVLQMERRITEISDQMQSVLALQLAKDFGINLKRLDLSTIEIDKESPDYDAFVHATKEQQKIQAEQIGRRAQIETDIYAAGGHLGVQTQNLQAHAINRQAEVLSAAANNIGQMGQMMGDGSMNPIGMMMGMGLAAGMGQQMAGMMNGGLNAMHQATAGAPVPPPVPGAVSYMMAVNGQQYGPYTMPQMQQMAQTGQLTAQSLVWCAGMAAWETAASRPDLASLFAPAVPPTPPTPPMPPSQN